MFIDCMMDFHDRGKNRSEQLDRQSNVGIKVKTDGADGGGGMIYSS